MKFYGTTGTTKIVCRTDTILRKIPVSQIATDTYRYIICRLCLLFRIYTAAFQMVFV